MQRPVHGVQPDGQMRAVILARSADDFPAIREECERLRQNTTMCKMVWKYFTGATGYSIHPPLPFVVAGARCTESPSPLSRCHPDSPHRARHQPEQHDAFADASPDGGNRCAESFRGYGQRIVTTGVRRESDVDLSGGFAGIVVELCGHVRIERFPVR